MKLSRSIPALLAAATLAHAPAAFADVVLDWNAIGLARAMAAKQLPPDAARTMAMMHVAMFDAVNAIEPRYRPYAFRGTPRPAASPEAAAVAAAHATLAQLFPEQAQVLDEARAASLSRIDEGDAKIAGLALGREAALQCVQLRAQDGSGKAGAYAPRVQPGVYVATAYPVSSEWARVKPFVMRDAAQFRPPPPPSLDGQPWSRDLEEIRAVGGRASVARTREQTDVARFWAITGPASWNPLVRALAQSRSASLVDNARLFALVNMAATDAFIAVFDAKYAYEFWRPVTAVRHAGDPAWLPLVDTPMHPEYPCAHCISSAAVATVLEAHFGRGSVAEVSMTSPTAPGVTRRWSRIADYATEVNNARIWAGVHYRNSTEVGERMGRLIGTLAVERHLAVLEPGREAAPAAMSAR
jgi:hypothetical protein